MKKTILLIGFLTVISLAVYGQNQDRYYAYLSQKIAACRQQGDFDQENKYHAMAIAHFDSLKSQMIQMGITKDESAFSAVDSYIKVHHDMMVANQIEVDASRYSSKQANEMTQAELEYEIACGERLLTHLDTASEALRFMIPGVKDLIALKETRIVTSLITQGDYQSAKKHINHALEKAQPGGKAYYVANNWAGILYDYEAREISTIPSRLAESVSLYERAVMYFSQANRMDNVLDAKIGQAMCMKDMNQKEESKRLLSEVIAYGKGIDSLDLYVGESTIRLGQMAKEEDRYDEAIQLLEEGYMLITHYQKVAVQSEHQDGTLTPNKNVAHIALVAADGLVELYTKMIPNKNMRVLWEKRRDECRAISEAQVQGMESFLSKRGNKYEHSKADRQLEVTQRLTLGMELLGNGQYQEGVNSLTRLARELEQSDEGLTDLLVECYTSLCTAKLKKEDFIGAIKDGTQALSLLNRMGENGKKEKASLLYRMTIVFHNMGDAENALSTADSCVAASEDYYGPLHTETLDAYDLRANVAAMSGKKEQALSDMAHCFEIVHSNVVHNFVYLTTAERTAYWKRFSELMRKMPVFADGLANYESTYTDALFEEQLLSKGLLLTAESELRQAIASDVELRDTYERIRALREVAMDAHTAPSEAEKTLAEADHIERQLGTKANSLHGFMDFLNVGIGDVRKYLRAGCAAVEFVDYPGKDGQAKLGAAVLLPGKPHVRFIPLGYEDELQMAVQTQGRQQEKIGAMVWQPILDYVGESVHDIYFAPTAILYQLPIESATLSSGAYIENQSRKLHRLSSTRWLAIQSDTPDGHNAVVYGGLRYNATVTEMSDDAGKYPQNGIDTSLLAFSEENRSALYHLKYLTGTKVEADSIVQTLNKGNRLKVDTLYGINGTEASFKALSGQRKKIIHIGTHGFYDNKHSNDDLESALDWSGLYFAGADNRRFGKMIPEGVDDGVLTAREIGGLDLRGLKLITLSACETGQGAVSGDGVFGLQRGFKKAGAESILMSLWKVDDAATCTLMTEFYRQWTSGASMHDALEAAKRIVRETKGWEDPKFWSAFILLDGLE